MIWLKAIPRLVWEAFGFVALFLVGTWALSCHDANVVKNARANAAVDSGTKQIAVAHDTLRVKDSTVVHDRIRYVDARTAVLPAAARDTTVGNFVKASDKVVASDSAARKAAQGVVDSQAAQIKRLAAMKALTLPRLSFTAEVLRDVPNQEWIGRACANYRTVAQVEVTACGEARPKETAGSALIGLRYTFR